MFQIDDKILSADLLQQHFSCDLHTCGGVCCVHGASGAPLEPDEEQELRRELSNFAIFLTEKGRKAIAEQGVAVIDGDGDLTTPLVPNGEECAYAYFTPDGLCLCAIERAFLEGKTAYRKPISCHLYPIRVKKCGENHALYYDQWGICSCAREKGEREKLPVFRFLKEPIIRKFGEKFHEQLEEVYTQVVKRSKIVKKSKDASNMYA